MPVHITRSEVLNGEWFLDCTINNEADRSILNGILEIMAPGAPFPQYPLATMFTLHYSPHNDRLFMIEAM